MILKGIDNIKQYDNCFRNKRLGLITSISGMDNHLNSTIDVLNERYQLIALFAPEHGVRGDKEAGQTVDTYIDETTGIPVYSLYRKDSKNFTKEMLDDVDAVVYDIQDLGVRYYTFISTMINALEDCAEYGKEFIVLDRPDPLGGNIVEGNVLDIGYKSFIGAYPITNRYGLTPGELALMVKDNEHISCKLTVIPCSGWERDQLFPKTGQIWIMPSPAMPNFETALLYTGTCLAEGTNLSVGRGTSCPFAIIGAPYINAVKLVNYLKERKLPGAAFTPAYFTPSGSRHKDVFCQGVHLHITDYDVYESYRTGLVVLDAVRNLYPDEFIFLPPEKSDSRPHISLLSGNDAFEHPDWSVEAILGENRPGLEQFREAKQKYHLYK